MARYSTRFGHTRNDPKATAPHRRGQPHALSLDELKIAVWDHFLAQFERQFWSKVDRRGPDECWPWRARKKNGYGFLRIWPLPGHPEVRATRAMWMLVNGVISNDRLVCHSCDNPACVNPAHLFLGTAKDNAEDMIRKGRNAPRRGEDNHYAKLTEADVREIRSLAASHIPGTEIARRFSISNSTVSMILRGRNWRHVA